MKTERLNAIKERVKNTTNGPWKMRTDSNGDYMVIGDNPIPPIATYLFDYDAEFIAHAREDVPALVAEVERLREALSFYADKNNWNRHIKEPGGLGDNGYTIPPLWEPSSIEFDKGNKARKALEGEPNE